MNIQPMPGTGANSVGGSTMLVTRGLDLRGGVAQVLDPDGEVPQSGLRPAAARRRVAGAAASCR